MLVGGVGAEYPANSIAPLSTVTTLEYRQRQKIAKPSRMCAMGQAASVMTSRPGRTLVNSSRPKRRGQGTMKDERFLARVVAVPVLRPLAPGTIRRSHALRDDAQMTGIISRLDGPVARRTSANLRENNSNLSAVKRLTQNGKR